MERDGMFNVNTRDGVQTPQTNDEYYARGMPVRASYSVKKPLHDSNRHESLDNFKFEDKIDMSQGMESRSFEFADIDMSMSKMSVDIDPVYNYAKNVEILGSEIFSHMKNCNCPFVFNIFNLYNMFSLLYSQSTGATQIELKDFFHFPDRETLIKCAEDINKTINEMKSMVNSKNMIVVGNDVPVNKSFKNDKCIIFPVNIRDPLDEADRLNAYIKKLMVYDIKKTVIPEHLMDLQMMLVNLMVIKPRWNNQFDTVVKFNDKKYMAGYCKKYNYYVDDAIELFEVNSTDDILAFGLVKNIGGGGNGGNGGNGGINTLAFDCVKIKKAIKGLKPTYFDEVYVPSIKINFKCRITNILRKMGLTGVFTTCNVPSMFSQGVSMHDIVQNIIIDIDNYDKNDPHQKKGGKKFFVQSPYVYYFRLVKINTFILIGAM